MAKFSKFDGGLLWAAFGLSVVSHIYLGDVVVERSVSDGQYIVFLRNDPDVPVMVSAFKYYATMASKFLVLAVGIYIVVKAFFVWAAQEEDGG